MTHLYGSTFESKIQLTDITINDRVTGKTKLRRFVTPCFFELIRIALSGETFSRELKDEIPTKYHDVYSRLFLGKPSEGQDIVLEVEAGRIQLGENILFEGQNNKKERVFKALARDDECQAIREILTKIGPKYLKTSYASMVELEKSNQSVMGAPFEYNLQYVYEIMMNGLISMSWECEEDESKTVAADGWSLCHIKDVDYTTYRSLDVLKLIEKTTAIKYVATRAIKGGSMVFCEKNKMSLIPIARRRGMRVGMRRVERGAVVRDTMDLGEDSDDNVIG